MRSSRTLVLVAQAAGLLVTFAGAAVVMTSCKSRQSSSTRASSSAQPAPKAAARVLRRRPKDMSELPTTEADIYLKNLDGQIDEIARLVGEHPELTNNVQRLSAARYLRGRYRDDVDEIQQAIDGASSCIKVQPKNGVCYLLRAEQEQSLHRFKEARADLERARELGGVDRARITDTETELDWNDGLYDKAIPAIHKARHDRPSTGSWMREAQLAHDLGLDDEADAAFEAAEDLITDTAPLAVAHLDVQRGIQKTQQGLLEEACVFFREAIARLPMYIAANEHLAETLGMLGRTDEAIAIYEKVVAQSNDPEFAHALAELYVKKGKSAEAKPLEQKAHAGYEALLKKYPEAMYWHGSEFFMSAGDPKRALELLQKNVVLRPNATSYVALARAELANKETTGARTSIDKALAMPLKSASLFWTASRIYRASGDATAADAFRERAKKLNPRIEQDETPVSGSRGSAEGGTRDETPVSGSRGSAEGGRASRSPTGGTRDEN